MGCRIYLSHLGCQQSLTQDVFRVDLNSDERNASVEVPCSVAPLSPLVQMHIQVQEKNTGGAAGGGGGAMHVCVLWGVVP